MKRWISLVFIFTMIVYVGCATMRHGSKAASKQKVTTASTDIKLPESYAPITQSSIRARQIAIVFKQVESLKTARSFTPAILKDINGKSSLTGGVLSKCDFDVIKAFVAAGWTPAVLLRTPSNSMQMRTVIGYNDSSEELVVMDPKDLEESRQFKIGYAALLKTWDDPDKTCLLVFPTFVSEQTIKNALLKFLPNEKVDSVVIKVSK